MRIVFCSDPLNPGRPDPAYEREVAAARSLAIPFDVIDHDALVRGRLERVPRWVEPIDTLDVAVFRGWMATARQYEQLHSLLGARGRHLINSPVQYEHCHHLPASYPLIEGHTPRSVWLGLSGAPDIDQVMRVLEPLGDRPVVVKDFVKSQKHAWTDACFIPSATDRSAVERVVGNFLAMQGSDLNVGLVFREFVELERIGLHPRSGMPLSREFRRFYLDGEPLLGFDYWEEFDQGDAPPPVDLFAMLARRVESRFFTLDAARTKAGDWIVIELGDGQVAGLPDSVGPERLFRDLRSRLAAPP